MEMFAHDGIGTQIDGEYRTQQFDSIDDQLASAQSKLSYFDLVLIIVNMYEYEYNRLAFDWGVS